MTDKYLGQNLIFIISMPRSGSTLLQRVLGGHTSLVFSSEPWIMLNPVYGTRTAGIETEYDVQWANLGVSEFLEHYTDGPEVYDDAIRAFANTIYANAIAKAGGQRFIDKTPRYVLIIDDLIRLFPAAKFIFLLRNPLSVLSSIVNTQIQDDLWGLENFSEELLRGPVSILQGIETLGDKAVVVRYEDFVSAPEKNLEKICASLNLEYEPGMTEYDNSNAIQGRMQDRTGVTQFTQPDKSRAESWRDLLNNAQQTHFAQCYLRTLGRDTLDAFGYSYDDLTTAVRVAAQRQHKAGWIFPWQVAIKHPRQLGGKDQYAVSKYYNIRDHGPYLGRLLMARDFFKALATQVRFLLSGG
jgi:hypothetical protein